MGAIIRFPGRAHVRASTGYKSGRNSCRGTPDKRSTAKTRKGGTSSHCETACVVIPMRRANSAWPPARSIAIFSAVVLSFMVDNSSIALPISQALLHCADQAVLYDIEMTLGKRIKAARERLVPRMTQGALGANFDISDKAVSGWERDEAIPEVEKIAKIAKILKVPAMWLLEGRGPPPEPDGLESLIEGLDPTTRSLFEALARTLIQQRGSAA